MRTAFRLGVLSTLALSAFVSAQAQDGSGADVYVTPASIHRAFFKPADPALERLRATGAVLRVEDYRSFVLAVFDERPIGGRAALASLGVPIRDDQVVIGINGAPLDTADRDGLAGRLATIPAFLRVAEMGAGAPATRTLWIVQFGGPIKDEWLERLRSTGAVVVSPMATNGYVVMVDPAALPALADFQNDASVQWIGAYHPFFRLAPELRMLDFASQKQEDVTIQIIDDDAAVELIDALRSARFPVLRQSEVVLNLINVRISVPANLLPALAAHPSVFAIEPLPGVRMNDEAQGQIVAGNLNAGLTGPSAPGYLSWLASKGFSSGQFGFAVDVTDDGIDKGSTSDVNAEFKVLGTGASRVAYVNNYTSDASGDSGDGHGNINASIVFGYNATSGSAFQDANGYSFGLGICPFVQVGASKVFDNGGNGDFFGTNSARMTAAYNGSARISSHSWGYINLHTYNADSQSYDSLVRDGSTSAGNQEMTIVFAAGNDGSGAGTVSAPGTAKNVITVGASENNRQTGTDGCGVGDSGANNAMDIINFSSRGPCTDQRKKPDIMAPGTHIEGAASRSPTYNGSGVCNQYWPAAQTLYAWSSGTSHSTPAIAGSSALVRQYFANQGWATPSPAMVKAFLMSSTRYMSGVGANDTLWSNAQGMGLVDLGRAFDGVARVQVDETQLFGATGQNYVVSGSIVSSASPFRVALVWTDPPGPTSGNAYVNNLDLSVVVNGTTYLGNVFTGANSTTGGAADARNNAEFVFLPTGTTGSFSVTVTATNIAGDGVPGNGDSTDQDFALVIYNGTTCAAVSITSQPQGQAVCPGSPATFTVAASGPSPTYQWRKNGSNIAGETATSYSIPSVVSGDAGNYDVVVTSGCSVTSSVAALSVSTAPAITVQPAGGTSCTGTSKTFSVTATGTAPTYQWRKDTVNIAGATASSYVLGSVVAGDAGTYDVIVTNACGSATSSGAVLTVSVAVSITVQPVGQTVCQGSGASFSVTATGTAPTYQWRKNLANISGATSATYSITSTVAGDAANYTVVVTNACGSVTSANAGLVFITPAAVVFQPSGSTVCQGAGASFSVIASGSLPLSYQWRKDAVNIGGATSSSYAIASTVPGDSATYTVVVTNGCNSATSAGAVLTVNTAPSITTPPSGATVCEGASASFSVVASGTAPLTYQWRKNGSDIGGATSSSYAIASTVAADAGSYDVVVTNGCGSVTSAPASLTSDSVSIGSQPSGQSVCAGDAVNLSVSATGAAPLTYQWRKNGVDVAGATAATLAISSASGSDSGTYDVVVTNTCGPAASNGAVVAVTAPTIAGIVPSSIAPMISVAPDVTISVSGACFLPTSVVYANGVALTTTFVDASNLTCLLGPAVPQTLIPGGICINVQNTIADVSNSVALVVGSGSNAGTIRRQPLAPSPGDVYAIVMEGAPPFAVFSLFVDFGSVAPVTGFPDAVTDLVLAVSPLTGSAGPFMTIFDGLGIFGPPIGIAFDGSGKFVIPGIVLPNPPLGAAVTIQVAYLDPSSPIGLRLTWAKFPEQI